MFSMNMCFPYYENYEGTEDIAANLSASIGNKRSKSKRSRFSKEEDDKLDKLVIKYGQHNWQKIADKIGTKSVRQCRDRWKNYVDPNLNSNDWSNEEDNLLITKFYEIGPHWRQVAAGFNNRSINCVRNRLIKLLKNYQISSQYLKGDTPFNIPNQYEKGKYAQSKTSDGIFSRLDFVTLMNHAQNDNYSQQMNLITEQVIEEISQCTEFDF
ncbi:DNA-binding protein reb1 [Tritrichomonas foetus]|uniref:DNA-binding protein reb1 n=1 Tax=Tritrichomonas foetus TaxID=1144522 RepID=A0A1J4JG69_9EUKA|nr:DNA-binding protein reb1 [Tritrichomonas foetus]|eukprot:OHS98138.1 DNA-binding protein reb1 [Tritrichomonas foetus]